MSNIYALYCILSIDHNKKENLIISTKNDVIDFPIFKIEHPRALHNELRYNLQKILFKQTYEAELIKKITFSYLDIQNELVLQYLTDNYADQYDLNNDVFILCGAIIEKPYELNLFEWKKFQFAKSLTNMDLITSIIDFTVEKSIL